MNFESFFRAEIELGLKVTALTESECEFVNKKYLMYFKLTRRELEELIRSSSSSYVDMFATLPDGAWLYETHLMATPSGDWWITVEQDRVGRVGQRYVLKLTPLRPFRIGFAPGDRLFKGMADQFRATVLWHESL